MSTDTVPQLPSTPWGRAKAWSGRMYSRVESYANTPAAFTALVVVSTIDSAFFPVPPFALLIPMIVAAPHRWLRLTLWGTLASIVGSFLGYGIGAAMRGGLNLIHIDPNVRLDLGPDWLRKAELVLAALAAAVAILSALQGRRQRSASRLRSLVAAGIAVLLLIASRWTDWFSVHGTLAELLSQNWWSLAVVCMVVPAFKLATIGSGLVGVSLLPFLGAVTIARIFRFGVASALARFGGPPVREWLLRHAHAHASETTGGRPVET